jgi:hypothetical protein
MRKRGIELKINLSNKVVYSLIVIGILVIIGVGVWAYGTSEPSNFGHSLGELETCDDGETLMMVNEEWTCVSQGSSIELVSGPLNNKIVIFSKAYSVVRHSCKSTCENTAGLISGSAECVSAWRGSGIPVGCNEDLGTDINAVCLCRGLSTWNS